MARRTRSFTTRTFRKKVFAAVYNVDGGLKSKRILRAASEKSSSNKLINALFVANQITSMRYRVNGRTSGKTSFASKSSLEMIRIIPR